MGAKQSVQRNSYLDDYPNPLGRFKSAFNIRDVSLKVENRHQKVTHTDRWFVKMNIHFTHGIHLPNEMDRRLRLVVYCGVERSTSRYWRVKANVKFVVHNFNDKGDSLKYDYGDTWFDNYTGENPLILQATSISLNSLLDEDFGFLKNNEMRMGTDIRVLEVVGFHQPTVINYRVPHPTNPSHHQIFSFPDEKLYIDKAIIKPHCISRGRYISIRTVDAIKTPSTGALEELFDCVYGFPLPLYGRARPGYIFKVTKLLKMRSVTQRLSQMLVNDMELEKNLRGKLEALIELDMRRVVHAWLNRKKSIEKTDVESLKIDKMSGEIMKAIVKRVLELGWAEEEE